MNWKTPWQWAITTTCAAGAAHCWQAAAGTTHTEPEKGGAVSALTVKKERKKTMLEMKPERESKVIRIPRDTSEKLSYISEQTGTPVSQVARRLIEYAMEHVTLKKIPQYYIMFDEE